MKMIIGFILTLSTTAIAAITPSPINTVKQSDGKGTCKESWQVGNVGYVLNGASLSQNGHSPTLSLTINGFICTYDQQNGFLYAPRAINDSYKTYFAGQAPTTHYVIQTDAVLLSEEGKVISSNILDNKVTQVTELALPLNLALTTEQQENLDNGQAVAVRLTYFNAARTEREQNGVRINEGRNSQGAYTIMFTIKKDASTGEFIVK